jgi:site-specific recombinase XerD
MKLFFTDASFVEQGVSRPGIPFLCNSSMELVAAPNDFLHFIAVTKGRTRSRNTWRTYGHHLYEYFAFLEENKLDWTSITERHIAAWRDGMLQRGCTPNTVNQRLRCVGRFYEWNSQQGKRSPLFSREEVWVDRQPAFLAHVSTSGAKAFADQLTLRSFKTAPKFLLLDRAIAFLEALTPHSLKLMGYLALLTGMRREEVTALDYRVVPNPAGLDPDRAIPMRLDPALTPTKGSKERTVMLPYDLAVAMWDYFFRDWPKRCALHKRKHAKESTRFFLSLAGEELSLRYLNNQFSRASRKSGIACHPHVLRHTFGTYELQRMIRSKGQTKALMWVRDRMGHSSITTTEQYIHATDLIGDIDVDGYQAEVCEALRHGS